ncbi:MAG: hypothetical protein H7069_04000 [Phormidesmis sp. FL-bin-119]|nr:hypothetical protein [Pedobacter sp.]
MKKVFLSALIAVFAVSAFAQTGKNKNEANKMIKADAKEAKIAREKVESPSDDPKDKFDNDQSRFDINNDGIFSPEEKVARKTAKRAYKADRYDDGILNGSANDHNNHGKDVSGLATGTSLEGREKGKAVSDLAGSKARKAERVQPTGDRKPKNVGRHTGAGKPATTGRPMGAGRKH